MRPRRLVLATVLAALSAVAVLFARDLRVWDGAIRADDVSFALRPGAARWSAEATLPGDPAARLLGVQGDLAYRRALDGFLAVEHAPPSKDGGATSNRERGNVEGSLAAVSRAAGAARSSRASNLLGILAFSDSLPSGPAQPAPVESSVADFRAAVQADTSDIDAKFNLELVLRLLQVHGPGRNANATEGVQRGRQGESGGLEGRGY